MINPKHTDYISELVDDSQYNEILGYLPRKIDQTSQDGILRALRLAVNSWKLDKGIVGDTDVKKTKQKTSADAKVADLAAINSSVSHSKNDSVKKRKKHILKRNIPVSEWYK